MNILFNYIVPIFNKEDILPKTLEGIEKCASLKSKIILVVDGCTDGSESIVDNFIKNSSHKTEKIIMPNVHMLLSVNAGLKKVSEGYSIIMQDDIILKDINTENKILRLYERIGNKLGVISFRYGSNIEATPFIERLKQRTLQNMITEADIIKGPDDYANYPSGKYNNFYPRMNAINGPNCIPWNLLYQNGLLDENLAPYGYDDPEYCIRALKLGYINGLFPIKYESKTEWGGTRRSKSYKQKSGQIHKRNRIYVYKKHAKFLTNYLKTKKIYKKLETM